MNYPKNATLLSLVSLILALVYLDPDKSEFGEMPVPTEIIQKKKDRKQFKKDRKEWLENMHRTAPGGDWKKMDQQTKEFIDNEINNNEVCLFMKGTPDAPQCGFSMAVSNILKLLEVKFKGINVLENEQLRLGIKEYSEWPTIPQLYIKKEFVGGCDIVKEMYGNGELNKVLEDKKIVFKK